MNNFSFQFYKDNGDCICDAVNLTKENSIDLWDKFWPTFIEFIKDGVGAQICIWNENTSTSYYTKKFKDSHTDEYIIINNKLYVEYGVL